MLSINMLHTGAMRWWEVGRLNKKFGGQVLFPQILIWIGGIAIFCAITLLIWCFKGWIGVGRIWSTFSDPTQSPSHSPSPSPTLSDHLSNDEDDCNDTLHVLVGIDNLISDDFFGLLAEDEEIHSEIMDLPGPTPLVHQSPTNVMIKNQAWVASLPSESLLDTLQWLRVM